MEIEANAVQSEAKPLTPTLRKARQKIFAAAKHAVLREGVDIDIRSIAQEAGVALSTLYRHFSSKDLLISEIYLQVVSQHADAVLSSLTDEMSDAEKVRVNFRMTMDLLRDNPVMWDLLSHSRHSMNNDLSHHKRQAEVNTAKLYERLLTHVESEERKTIALLLMGIFFLRMTDWRTGVVRLQEVEAELDKAVVALLENR